MKIFSQYVVKGEHWLIKYEIPKIVRRIDKEIEYEDS